MTFNKLTPNLAVPDIKASVKFYQQNLGFKLIMAVPATEKGIEHSLSESKDYVYALIAKDDVEIMMQQTKSFKHDVCLSQFENLGASVSFYMEIEGIEQFYKEIVSKTLKSTSLKTTWYGMQEFYILDNNGYVLGFAEKST